MHSDRAPLFLKVATWGGVIFLHFPLLIIALYRRRRLQLSACRPDAALV